MRKSRISYFFHDLSECPEDRLRASLAYVKEKVNEGLLDVGTYKDFYNRYYYNGTL